jgi:hypothetical protein
MKHLSKLLPKLMAIGAIALSMSSCNRAEYAMLPKTTSYHGTERVAARPQPQPASVGENAQTTEASSPKITAIPEAAAPAVAVAPKADAPAPKVAAPKTTKSASVATRKAPAFLQHALLKKVTKRAEKIADKMLVKKNQETAGTEQANAISGNLRTGIILLLVGLLISIIPGDVFDLVGGIIAIIGIIFIVLWLLDNL